MYEAENSLFFEKIVQNSDCSSKRHKLYFPSDNLFFEKKKKQLIRERKNQSLC